MRVFKDNDVRSYPFVIEFIKNNYSLINYSYYASSSKYFKNIINDCIWIYRLRKQNEYDQVAIKYYEGIIKQLYYYIDSLNIKIGYDFCSNKIFDFEKIIDRCEQQLPFILKNAQEKFELGLYSFGAFHIGQYYGNKEIIEICKKFKGEG